MNILYLVNQLSITSVPSSWKNYEAKYNDKIIINMLSLKEFKFISFSNIINSDIINGHHIKVMSLFLMLNFLFRKKTVYTVHGSYEYLSSNNKILLRYIFKKVDKVIFVNKYLYNILPKDHKETLGHKYEVVLNGVDISFNHKKNDMFLKYNLNKKDEIIFHPARFVVEKNHLSSILAFKKLLPDNPNIKYVLAGDGALKSEIISLIDKLDLHSNILLLGLIPKDDVYNFLEICELFIMPSISEGLNISFLEALSMKTKVVVSNIEQFKYPFSHYQLNPSDFNVFFADPNSIEDLHNNFDKALSSKRKLKFSMAKFGLNNMLYKHAAIYKNLL